MFAEMKEGRVLVPKAVSLRAASWTNRGQAALSLMERKHLPPEEVARLCLCLCACTPNTRAHESDWQPPVVPLFCLPGSLAAPPPPVPSSSANPCAQLLTPLTSLREAGVPICRVPHTSKGWACNCQNGHGCLGLCQVRKGEGSISRVMVYFCAF